MNGKPVFTVPAKTVINFTKDTAPWWEIQRENGAVLL